MTLDEAAKVAGIVATADDHCVYCVQSLVELLNDNFPQFVWERSESGTVTVKMR